MNGKRYVLILIMTIHPVTNNDFEEWLRLALELWPDHSPDEMRSILAGIFASESEAAFLFRDEAEAPVGFMNLSLRTDYVPGATQKPVAYVEGIYVRAAYQRRGIGKQLIERAEQWAREQGSHELASDVLLDNQQSADFHVQAGFEEVDRVISFIKNV